LFGPKLPQPRRGSKLVQERRESSRRQRAGFGGPIGATTAQLKEMVKNIFDADRIERQTDQWGKFNRAGLLHREKEGRSHEWQSLLQN